METIKPKRRQAKNPIETVQIDTEKEDFDKEVDEENFQPTMENGEALLEVECGTNKAKLFLSKLAEGSKGPCVFFHGSWLTPNEFQYVSGRATAKDWKRSIRYNGKSLKLLFAKGILSLGKMTKNGRISKRKTKKRPGRKPKRGKQLFDQNKEEDIEKEELKEQQSSDQHDDSSTENSTTSHDSETDLNDIDLEPKQEEKKDNVEPSTNNPDSDGEKECITKDKNDDVDFLDDDTEMASDEECNLAEVTCEDAETRRIVDDMDDNVQNLTEYDTSKETLSHKDLTEPTLLTEMCGTDENDNEELEKPVELPKVEEEENIVDNTITPMPDGIIICNDNYEADNMVKDSLEENINDETNSEKIEESIEESVEFRNDKSDTETQNEHEHSHCIQKEPQHSEVMLETDSEMKSSNEHIPEDIDIIDSNCEDRETAETTETLTVSQFQPAENDGDELSTSPHSTVNSVNTPGNAIGSEDSGKTGEHLNFTMANKANYLSKLLQELRESKQEHCSSSSPFAETTTRPYKGKHVSEKGTSKCISLSVPENHKVVGGHETSLSQASENRNIKINTENVTPPKMDYIYMANDKRHNGLIENQSSMKQNKFRGQQPAPTKAENYSDYMRMLASTCVQPSIYLSQYAADRIFPFKSTDVCMPPGACPPHFPFGLKFPPPKCICCVPSSENRTSPISPPFYCHLQRPSHDFPLPLFNPYFAMPPPLIPLPWAGSMGDKNIPAKRTLPKEGNILDLSPKKVKFSFNET